MRADHPLAKDKHLYWDHLDSCKMLHLPSDKDIRSEVEALHQQRIIHYAKTVPILETSNPNVLAAPILKGSGIAVLPALVAKSSSFCELIFIPLQPPIE